MRVRERRVCFPHEKTPHLKKEGPPRPASRPALSLSLYLVHVAAHRPGARVQAGVLAGRATDGHARVGGRVLK